MSTELKPLGVDPLFPGGGNAYISDNGFYLNDHHGGPKAAEWIEKNFEAREDDVYVVSYPKTGTTWAQEISYIIGNDLNFDKAKSTVLVDRFPYLEMSLTVEKGTLNQMESPRFIKSHYPYSLLPKSIIDKNCKIIYTVRNPKDTVVSFYHFAKANPVLQFQGDLNDFFNLFIKGERIIYSPYGKHVLEFWEQRDRDNILIVHYEDLQKDCIKEIHRIAHFLGKNLTDEEAEKVAAHCSFKNMKSNKSTNYKQFLKETDFMRKGEVGDWKNHLTEEMCKKMDDSVDETFKYSSFEFKY